MKSKVNSLIIALFICGVSSKSFGQDFNFELSKDSIVSFFKFYNIDSQKQKWGYTFIEKDSNALKVKLSFLGHINLIPSDVYVIDEDECSLDCEYLGYYAIDAEEIESYTAKSFIKRYSDLLKLASKLKLSLIGFQFDFQQSENEESDSQTIINKQRSLLGRHISGVVKDADTKMPLPFVNIGIIGEGIGTISDSNGYFIMELPTKSLGDDLTFSYMGYKSQKINIIDLRDSLNKIFLKESTIVLNEVSVYSNKIKTKKIKELGVKTFRGNQSGFINAKGKGAEISRLINNSRKVRIVSMSIYVINISGKAFKLRANVYGQSSQNGFPGSNLLQKSAIITSNMDKGWLTYKFDTPVYIDSNFFIGFEWIGESLDTPTIGIKGSSTDGKVFQRIISLDRWLPSSDFNWVMKCKVEILE